MKKVNAHIFERQEKGPDAVLQLPRFRITHSFGELTELTLDQMLLDVSRDKRIELLEKDNAALREMLQKALFFVKRSVPKSTKFFSGDRESKNAKNLHERIVETLKNQGTKSISR